MRVKYVLYKSTGTFEPSTIKECTSIAEQREYCASVNCPDCYYCVWADASKPTGKEVIIDPNENKHPLHDIIIDRFNGFEIN